MEVRDADMNSATYKITHTTTYIYGDTVPVCHNEVHLAPRDTFWQICQYFKLVIKPHPDTVGKRNDYFGNQLHHFSIQEGHRRLCVTATSRVGVRARELAPPERERFLHEWFAVQSRFVDHPKGALVEADELVCSLLQARGYPATSFEQSAEHLSVDHPRLIENFRTAHAAIERSVRGEANTEELRAAMIHYRALFDELTQTKTVVP